MAFDLHSSILSCSIIAQHYFANHDQSNSPTAIHTNLGSHTFIQWFNAHTVRCIYLSLSDQFIPFLLLSFHIEPITITLPGRLLLPDTCERLSFFLQFKTYSCISGPTRPISPLQSSYSSIIQPFAQNSHPRSVSLHIRMGHWIISFP